MKAKKIFAGLLAAALTASAKAFRAILHCQAGNMPIKKQALRNGVIFVSEDLYKMLFQ